MATLRTLRVGDTTVITHHHPTIVQIVDIPAPDSPAWQDDLVQFGWLSKGHGASGRSSMSPGTQVSILIPAQVAG